MPSSLLENLRKNMGIYILITSLILGYGDMKYTQNQHDKEIEANKNEIRIVRDEIKINQTMQSSQYIEIVKQLSNINANMDLFKRIVERLNISYTP